MCAVLKLRGGAAISLKIAVVVAVLCVGRLCLPYEAKLFDVFDHILPDALPCIPHSTKKEPLPQHRQQASS